MNDFVTIKTFTYPHEVAIIKGRLESEGIGCNVKDEVTAQVYSFYSNAIGGIKLQVRESDVEEAVNILKEGGYITDKDLEPPTLWTKLNASTSKIPFLENLRVEVRVLIIAIFLISVAVIIICWAGNLFG